MGLTISRESHLEGAWKAPVLVSAPREVFKALAKVFTTLGLPYDLIAADPATSLPFVDPVIGLLSYQSENEDEFKEGYLLLDSLGSRSIIVLDSSAGLKKLTQGYVHEARQEIEARCATSGVRLSELCESLQRLRNHDQPIPCETPATRLFRAERLFGLAGVQFGHDSKSDITNSVMGPARMLLTSRSEASCRFPSLTSAQEKVLRLFGDAVITKMADAPYLYGDLGKTLMASFADIKNSIESGELHDREALISSINRFLDCLTRAREIARKRIVPSDRPDDGLWVKPVKPRWRQHEDNLFRVLVVDDFASTWRPVLEQVCEVLKAQRLFTVFEFSVDGSNVFRGGKETVAIDEALPSYDLVLLDIFLGKKDKSGLQILDEIRDRFLWLPVILWTTSVASELPANAQLANGFIFKKCDTLGAIVNLLRRWLPEGRARRDAGLSSRLFDTILRSPLYRQCAITFEKTCLKILDSFHALDDSFFRLYTDHGGRHIRSLLHILEQLVNPFLGQRADGSNGVFSPKAAVRERELLQLYLAVLCHEIGMFPLRMESYPPTNRGSLGAIRVTHPIRGMLALMDGRYRPKELDDAIQCLDKLESGDIILMSVAVLTGYHARLLDLDDDNFLRTVGGRGEEKLSDAIDFRLRSIGKSKDKTVVPELRLVLEKLNALEALLFGPLVEGRRDEAARERLRRQCAVLRFADALDVDRTRIPLGFLLFDPNRDHYNIREHVKREILEEVEFGPRGIRLRFNAPRPNLARLNKFLGETVGLGKRHNPIAEPWHPANRENIRSLQKKLDDWLACYWIQVLWANLEQEKRKEFEHEHSFCSKKVPLNMGDLFDKPSRELIASATALSVAGEILDEYSAIESCGLESQIKLDGVTWKKSVDWSRLPLLSFRLERE